MRVAYIAGMLLFIGAAGSTQGLPADEGMSEVGAAENEVWSAEELIEAGARLMDLQHYDAAILAFSEILQAAPGHGLAYANRALAYGWTNRLDQARADLNAAEAVIPEHAIIHRIRALIAMRLSDFETAKAELSKSLVKEPGNPMALQYRAYIYHREGKEAAALADADAYINSHPDSPDAYVLKANLLIGQQNPELAIAEADRLTARFPGDPYAIAAAARIYDKLAQRDRALEAISNAISIETDFFYYHLLRAKFRAWDDFAGRRTDLEAAMRLDPRNADILTEFGLLDFREQRWTDAITKFSVVLDQEPKTSDCWPIEPRLI